MRSLALGALLLSLLGVGLLWQQGGPDAWGLLRSLFGQGARPSSVELPALERQPLSPAPGGVSAPETPGAAESRPHDAERSPALTEGQETVETDVLPQGTELGRPLSTDDPGAAMASVEEAPARNAVSADGAVRSDRADGGLSAFMDVSSEGGAPTAPVGDFTNEDALTTDAAEEPVARSDAVAAVASDAAGRNSKATDDLIAAETGKVSADASADVARPPLAGQADSDVTAAVPPDDPEAADLPLQALEADLRAGQVSVERVDANRLTADLGERVQFADGRVALDSDSEGFLKVLASQLKQSLPLQVRVVGHTDHRGPADVNRRLSERRAELVAKFLEDSGIPADDLSYEGKGESDPKVGLSQEWRLGPSANRRIELELVQPAVAQGNAGR